MHGELAAREIGRRIVEHKDVEVSVAVVIEEGGVYPEARVGESVFGCGFGERAVAIVDEEKIGAVLGLGVFGTGDGDVDVEITVVVDVDHRRAGGPSRRANSRALRDVL